MSVIPTPGPVCKAIEAQFDAWDAQIDDLKNKSKEAAMEQAKKIKKDIEDYAEKKGEELDKQKDETEAKTSTAEELKEIANPTKIEDALDAVQKTLKLVKDIADEILGTAADIMAAPGVLAKRSAESIGKLTGV